MTGVLGIPGLLISYACDKKEARHIYKVILRNGFLPKLYMLFGNVFKHQKYITHLTMLGFLSVVLNVEGRLFISKTFCEKDLFTLLYMT